MSWPTVGQLHWRMPSAACDGALDFADDMAGAAINDFVHFAFALFKLFGGGIAQGLHAEILRGLFALRAALGVFAAGQFVFDVAC